VLYDYYVQDVGIKKPLIHASYGESFFKMIKEAHEEGVDIFVMRIKDWYERLLKQITHVQVEDR